MLSTFKLNNNHYDDPGNIANVFSQYFCSNFSESTSDTMSNNLLDACNRHSAGICYP